MLVTNIILVKNVGRKNNSCKKCWSQIQFLGNMLVTNIILAKNVGHKYNSWEKCWSQIMLVTDKHTLNFQSTPERQQQSKRFLASQFS